MSPRSSGLAAAVSFVVSTNHFALMNNLWVRSVIVGIVFSVDDSLIIVELAVMFSPSGWRHTLRSWQRDWRVSGSTEVVTANIFSTDWHGVLFARLEPAKWAAIIGVERGLASNQHRRAPGRRLPLVFTVALSVKDHSVVILGASSSAGAALVLIVFVVSTVANDVIVIASWRGSAVVATAVAGSVGRRTAATSTATAHINPVIFVKLLTLAATGASFARVVGAVVLVS